MVFRYNPFTNQLDDVGDGSPVTGDVLSLTGNAGGAVLPDGAGNIDVIGTSQRVAALGSTTDGGGLFLTGNPGTNTLTATYESFGVDNVFLGEDAGNNALTGERLTGIGKGALNQISSGDDTVALGYNAGSAYTTESNNLALGSVGLAADSGVCRIGNSSGEGGIAIDRIFADATLCLGANSVDASTLESIVVGASNDITGSSQYSGIIGLGNQLSGAIYSVAFGSTNLIQGATSALCHGNNNTIGLTSPSAIVGSQGCEIQDTSECSFIAGSQTSDITGVDSALIGCVNCVLTGSNSLMLCAEGVNLTGDNSIACVTADLTGAGSFAFGRGTFSGGESVFLTDQQAVYAPGALPQKLWARFTQGCDLNTVTIANDGTLEAAGIENTPIGPTTPSTGNFSSATREGTVAISNLTQNTGTTNTTITSASMVAPILYGAMTEVGFSRLCSITGNNTTHDNAWSATAGTLQSSTSGLGTNYISFTAQADGNTLIYTIPTSLTVGIYRVRYRLYLNTNAGIVDFAYNPNSLGYTIIRNQIDCYQASVDNGDGTLLCEDYFSISSGQTGTCLLRWIVNGKNAASGGFTMILYDSLQVLKLG